VLGNSCRWDPGAPHRHPHHATDRANSAAKSCCAPLCSTVDAGYDGLL